MARKKLKKKTEKDTTSSILPVDVIETILSRLPVKSLVRFKTVSKSWEATISDPRFSEIFNIRQSNKQNLFLAWRSSSPKSRGSFSLIKLENKKFRTQSKLGNPFGDCYPLCSCNGIVLLSFRGNNVYTLWNPSIRKHTRIYSPHKLDRHSCFINGGLYHDSRTDDYKVVIIFGEYYSIFSCKSKTWTEKKHLQCDGLLHPRWGIFVDGCFYWWSRPKTDNGEIVYFDVRDDKWKTMQRPNDLKLADQTDLVIKLMLLSGRLCLFCTNRFRTKLQLWVMEKHNYSWRELMNIDNHLSIYGPICLTDQDYVVTHLKGSRFITYNHREKRFEKSWRFYGIFYCQLLLCSENLVFPIQNIEPINEEKGD